MEKAGSSTWVGVILLVGVVVFSIATIIAEPFEQETPQELYSAISANISLYQIMNLLATAGLIVLFAGFFQLLRVIRQGSRRLYNICMVLFAAASLFWIAELAVRFTSTLPAAESATSRISTTGLFTLSGVGFDLFFLGFFLTALVGAALLIWGLGKAGMIPIRLGDFGAIIILLSGAAGALFYPWVGGVERALFYPLFLVVLPLALILIFRPRRMVATVNG